jgi:hypothetical protein
MDNQTTQPVVSQTPQPVQQPLPTKPNTYLTKVLVVLLAIILVAGVGYGMYAWQHSKVSTLNSKVSSLEVQLSSTKSESASTPTKQTTTSSSANQDALSSPMPQSQFSNPAFTDTLNYLSTCVDNPGGSSKTISSTECSNGNQTYKAPTTFTYAMITNYSWLPESADTTFVNLAEQDFQGCTSSGGSGIGGSEEVNYSSANFVIFTTNICGSARTGLYQDTNGTWSKIASSPHFGTSVSCSTFSSDNIPENILQANGICSD